jgi:hypothetical protein
MQAAAIPSDNIRRLVEQGLFERLPPSFTAFFYQQILEWETLFPAERGYIERLFGLLQRGEAEQVRQLFAPLRELEQTMGIRPETWNPREFTLSHVDFLNRSPYYARWREEIARIFGVIDPMLDEEVARTGRRRLVIVISPGELPVGADRLWSRLQEHGKRIALEPVEADDYLSYLLTGEARAAAARSVVQEYAASPLAAAYDTWVIEAGHKLAAFGGESTVSLSFEALEPYRKTLMTEVSQMMNDEKISGPRELGRRLREMAVPSGDATIDRAPVLAEFLRRVMLAGNGTLLINNTFVEWAAVQAARHARPHVTVVFFGVRNKIKPFSGLLLYADQEKANVIPDQQDVLGSYVDIEAFYPYIWQGFEKYAEYRGKTAYLFVGELLDEAFVIAPEEFSLLRAKGAVDLARVHAECREWVMG